MDAPRNYQDESDGRWYPGQSDRYPNPEARYDDERYRVPEPRYDTGEPSGDLSRYRDRDAYPDVDPYPPPRTDPLTDPALAARGPSPMGPRSGVELPPLPPMAPDQAEPRFHTEPIDRSALRRQPAPPQLGGPGPVQAPPQGPGSLPGPGSAPGPGPAPISGPTMTVEAVGGAIYRTRHTGIAILLVVVAVVAELLSVRILLTGEFGHPFQPAAVLAGMFTMVGIPLVTMGLYGLMTGAATAAGPSPGRAWLRTPLALLPIGLVLIVAASLAG